MIGCKPPPFESAIIRTILKSMPCKRSFKVMWEKVLIDNDVYVPNKGCSTYRNTHYLAVVLLRRTFWSFLNYWLHHDFFDSFVEDSFFIEFIDDKLHIYKDQNDKSIVPLSMPLAFETAGVMIMILLNIE